MVHTLCAVHQLQGKRMLCPDSAGTNQNGRRRSSCLLLLTEKGGGGNCPVAAGDHHAYARLDERHGEVDDLRALLVDRERADGHVSSSVHDLRGERDEHRGQL